MACSAARGSPRSPETWGGKFDGASLIANFEQLNPANTYWTKEYNVYSKVDTEKQRFLEFETYWGSPVLLNAGEMQWIVDNLFVGNRLSTGQIRSSDGVRIDLRNIKSPIVCFCSWGASIDKKNPVPMRSPARLADSSFGLGCLAEVVRANASAQLARRAPPLISIA